jgi:hypothetical protein
MKSALEKNKKVFEWMALGKEGHGVMMKKRERKYMNAYWRLLVSI